MERFKAAEESGHDQYRVRKEELLRSQGDRIEQERILRFDAVRNNLERDKRARQFNAEQLRLKLSGVSQSVSDCSHSMAQQVMRRSRQSSFFETWSS